MEYLFEILRDGLFAAIAAIGFSSISNPPARVFAPCALIAAIGHMTRFVLMNSCAMSLTAASSIAGLVIGLLALPAAKGVKAPSECIFLPSLLPMVPGMYAYRSIQALMACLSGGSQECFAHYLYLLRFNWMTCMATIIGMVVCATLPVFIFKFFAFKVTK